MNTLDQKYIEKKLLYLGNELLYSIKDYINTIEDLKLYNEQFFIDWEDELNRLSTLNHDSIHKERRN